MKLNNSSTGTISSNVIAQKTDKQISPVETKVSSSVLQRLMQEVKNDAVNNVSAYNRTHNRHNRGR
ncbi:hypothetical protein LUD75_13725 [Epilithonimonas sp. JDS]|uniref:YhhA family cyclophane-containing RiPP n=1 Tax=Epilithonimonas sp. JDS TaxID=2902797 RepID=UPI001E424D3E|nr:YhhA family cyclophane-containing RiPP [Epilithonimonas sp. JDS]MCD9855778.1 hypothetical protein [Epilithonimonas sp. JDS]